MKHRLLPLLAGLSAVTHGTLTVSAQNITTNPLTVIERDLEQSPSSSSRNTVSDFGKRALAAANFALATKLENNGQLTDALAKYQLAAEADSTYIPTHIRIATVLTKLNKLPQAVALLQEKETAFPDSAEIKALLSYCHYRQNQPDKAIVSALAAQQLNPQLVSTYYLLAQCYLKQNQARLIPPLMVKSLAVNSNQSNYYSRLGDLWSQTLTQTAPLTDKEIAAQVLPFYEKARELNPANLPLIFHLGQLQFDLEDYPAAIGYYEQVYQKTPATPNLRERMALCYFTLNQPEKNIAVLESLLKDHPDRKKFYPMLADLYGRVEQWDKAANYYQIHLRLAPPDAKNYSLLAHAQLRAQRPTDALETLTAAENVFPKVLILKFHQTLVLRSLERWPEALAIFEKLEQQHDELIDSNFYFDYAATCEKSGDETKAETMFKKCLDLNPNHHEAMNYLGYMWAAKGRHLDEAEQLIAKALTFDPDNPTYLDSMAWVHYQKKEYDKALECQQKAAAAMPDDAEILDHLADIHYKLGNREQAIEAWSKASAIVKDPALLKVKIQSAKEQPQTKLTP